MAEPTVIDPLVERLLGGEALSGDERRRLAEAPDILALGMAADQLRAQRHGRTVTFCRVAALEVARLVDATAEWSETAGEVRLTGALDDLPATAAAVARVAAVAAGRVPLSGFSLADVERVSEGDIRRAQTMFEALRDAGLEVVSEAPVDAVRSLEALIGAARAAGLLVHRLTVLRAPHDRAALLERMASIVAGDPLIRAIDPLPRVFLTSAPTTGYDDVRLVALTRLLVPVEHVQVDWGRYGPKLAQVALTFGADDLDGVSPLTETLEGRRRAPLAEVVRNIEAAGGIAVERDGRLALRGR